MSPAAVDRAEREAASVGVSITFGVADFRALDTQVAGAFDIVLSCDNSLPHLLTDDDLRQAARGMGSRLRTGGLLLVSIRDYDRLVVARPRIEGPRIFDAPEGQRIVFQVWDWTTDGRGYTVHLFIMREKHRKDRAPKGGRLHILLQSIAHCCVGNSMRSWRRRVSKGLRGACPGRPDITSRLRRQGNHVGQGCIALGKSLIMPPSGGPTVAS
ncbi:MAG: class I SAM-dependent methyltransferase [Armatimonadota bacterium]